MATVKLEATRADFRVQVWAGPGATEGQRHALNRAVLTAIQKTGVWGERLADSVRMSDDQQGESSVYWSVNNIKQIDRPKGEELHVYMHDGERIVVPDFHLKATRVERRDGEITSAAWDHDIYMSTVYIAGRNGVLSIRNERV